MMFYDMSTKVYIFQRQLETLKSEIGQLSEDLIDIWPPGERKGSKPSTRFDIVSTLYFNMTHMYFPDDFTMVQKHKTYDLEDINVILNILHNKMLLIVYFQRVLSYVKAKVESTDPYKFSFLRLVNGYRTFDLARGLDYVLDLGFRDLTSGKEVIKR